MLQLVLDEIFMDPLIEDNVEDHLEEDYSDSDKFSPELDEEVLNEVADICNEPVPSTSYQFRLSLNRLSRTLWGVRPCSQQFCSSQSLPLLIYCDQIAKKNINFGTFSKNSNQIHV